MMTPLEARAWAWCGKNLNPFSECTVGELVKEFEAVREAERELWRPFIRRSLSCLTECAMKDTDKVFVWTDAELAKEVLRLRQELEELRAKP